MNDFITKKCQSDILYLRSIYIAWIYFITDATKSLVHAFVTSRLDYANSLLYVAPQSQLSRLQKMQNFAAHVITGARRSDHISPVLKELHWLPISKRTEFKILIHIFNSLKQTAPSYLGNLIYLIHLPIELLIVIYQQQTNSAQT